MRNKIAKEQIKKLIDISNNTVKALIELSNCANKEGVLREYFLANINTLKSGVRHDKKNKRNTSAVRRRRKRVSKKV
ncbi:MAG: hypothetical protein QXQ43_04495 [Nitrososphaerota archaeon]